MCARPGDSLTEILRTRAELELVQQRFVGTLEAVHHDIVFTAIGFQGGSYHTDVWSFPALGIWAHFGTPPSQKANSDRYWNVFGLAHPGKSVRIICEINSPFEGIRRRIGGVFAADESGRYLILHRGNFRARGLTKSGFWRQYRGPTIYASDEGQRRRLALAMRLDSPSAPEELRDFIREIARIKGLA